MTRPFPFLPRRWLGAALLACGLVSAAAAQDYPSKPVRIIVPFAPGGGSDVVARIVGERLGPVWKQPIVVENRPGAGGALGADMVAKAPADGHTLLVSDSSAVTMNPWLYTKLPYAPADLVPVIQVATFSLVVMVPSGSPAKTIGDLIAMDKAKPGSLRSASSGNGTSTHLVLEQINGLAGTQFVHVPYKGGGPAFVDLMGGQVDMMVSGLSASSSAILATGKARAIAVTAPKRVRSVPEVATLAESGFAGFEAVSAQTLFAPAGTPPQVVRKLNEEIGKLLKTPEIAERWAQAGYLPYVDETPAQLNAWFAKESARWQQLVRERKIRLE